MLIHKWKLNYKEYVKEPVEKHEMDAKNKRMNRKQNKNYKVKP